MPYKHKLSARVVQDQVHEPLPEPYERIRGIHVHSPRWGPGWLGFERVPNDLVVVWHVTEDRSSHPLNFDVLHVVVDPKTGDMWMVFERIGGVVYPFLMFPEESVSPKYAPAVIQRLLVRCDHE
jgi:hypothetical protein